MSLGAVAKFGLFVPGRFLFARRRNWLKSYHEARCSGERRRAYTAHLIVRGVNGRYACMRCGARAQGEAPIHRKACRSTEIKLRLLRRELLAGVYDAGLCQNEAAVRAASALGWKQLIA